MIYPANSYFTSIDAIFPLLQQSRYSSLLWLHDSQIIHVAILMDIIYTCCLLISSLHDSLFPLDIAYSATTTTIQRSTCSGLPYWHRTGLNNIRGCDLILNKQDCLVITITCRWGWSWRLILRSTHMRLFKYHKITWWFYTKLPSGTTNITSQWTKSSPHSQSLILPNITWWFSAILSKTPRNEQPNITVVSW